MSGVRASIAFVHIRKFYKIHKITFDSDSFYDSYFATFQQKNFNP